MKTVEEFLREHAVIDGNHNMDGSWVPLSIALIAAQINKEGTLVNMPASWKQTEYFVCYKCFPTEVEQFNLGFSEATCKICCKRYKVPDIRYIDSRCLPNSLRQFDGFAPVKSDKPIRGMTEGIFIDD